MENDEISIMRLNDMVTIRQEGQTAPSHSAKRGRTAYPSAPI